MTYTLSVFAYILSLNPPYGLAMFVLSNYITYTIALLILARIMP